MHHIWHSTQNYGQNFKQNLFEIYSKRTKIAITACKFSKIFGGASPRNPLELFLFLNQLQISSTKKLRLKKSENYAPPSFKISRYATA